MNERTAATLDAIRAFWCKHGYGPEARDIQAAIGVSSTSVARYHIKLLETAGLVVSTPGAARSIRLPGGEAATLRRRIAELETENALLRAVGCVSPAEAAAIKEQACRV